MGEHFILILREKEPVEVDHRPVERLDGNFEIAIGVGRVHVSLGKLSSEQSPLCFYLGIIVVNLIVLDLHLYESKVNLFKQIFFDCYQNYYFLPLWFSSNLASE